MKAAPGSGAGLRIGDVERQAAVVLLGEHWGAGRLDSDEFDDRTGRALTARTAAELALVFRDLPTQVPAERVRRFGPGAPRAVLAAAAMTAGAGALTAFLAIAEPYRLQVLANYAQQMLYRLGL